MSCCCNQSASASPFELPLTLGTAPSWPLTLSDDSTTPATALDLTGASLWFAAKAAPTDPDSAAVIFASTATGEITLTAPAAGQAQIDLTAAQTAESATLLPDRTYYAYLKVQLATGEIRTRSGWLATTAAGIETPSA